MPSMSRDAEGAAGSRHGLLWFVVAPLAVLAVLAVAILALTSQPGGGTGSASSTASTQVPREENPPTIRPPVDASAGPELPAPTPRSATASPRSSESRFPLPVVTETDVGATATPQPELAIAVPSIEVVTATGSGGIGDLAGRAVAVEVTIANQGPRAVSLDQVTVTMTAGAQGLPAPTVVSDPRHDPLTGRAAPRSTSTGTYVFHWPPGAQGSTLTVLVFPRGGAPAVAFSGSIS
jgi:hypothetical protein